MSAIPVTITGVLADKYGRTIQSVTLFGEMVRSDVGVGGGPIMPPDAGGGDGKPDHIWGGGNEPFPTPPIHLPKPPEGFPNPPADSGAIKMPPPGGGWGYAPSVGWGYFPGTGLVPGPKEG